MPEALTESYCERCGTRYEFAAPSQLTTLRRTRGVISGLRNYIMSQDTLGDSMADAMRSEEETLASRQLEAFHESFNFCIQCRQYACVNCWNEPTGRCRTCSPIAGTDDLIERFEASFHAQHPAADTVELDASDLNRRLGVDAWPSEDLSAGGTALLPTSAEAEAPAAAAEIAEMPALGADEWQQATAPAGQAPTEPQPAGTEAGVPIPGLDGDVPATAMPVPESPMLPAVDGPAIVRWEDDAAFELDPEQEPEPVAFEAPVEPEPAAFEAPLEPEPEPEPVAFEAPVEPEPIRPISETILHVPTSPPGEQDGVRVAAEAADPALAARRAKLDLLGLGDPGEGPVAAGRENVLPYRSTGASVHPAELAAQGDAASAAAVAGSFWEASAREVSGGMTHLSVQACGQCGLSLSASARFCRRCGARQAQSA